MLPLSNPTPSMAQTTMQPATKFCIALGVGAVVIGIGFGITAAAGVIVGVGAAAGCIWKVTVLLSGGIVYAIGQKLNFPKIAVIASLATVILAGGCALMAFSGLKFVAATWMSTKILLITVGLGAAAVIIPLILLIGVLEVPYWARELVFSTGSAKASSTGTIESSASAANAALRKQEQVILNAVR